MSHIKVKKTVASFLSACSGWLKWAADTRGCSICIGCNLTKKWVALICQDLVKMATGKL